MCNCKKYAEKYQNYKHIKELAKKYADFCNKTVILVETGNKTFDFIDYEEKEAEKHKIYEYILPM